MPAEPNATPKLLFAVGEAFGELFTAMYMAHGCGFRTVFVLRDPWYSLNRSGLPGSAYLFEGLTSLLSAIDKERPDLVCLFSGYLYVGDAIMDFDDLDRLVKYLRVRGIAVLTSDPFLGIGARLPLIDFRNPLARLLSLPLRLAGLIWYGPGFNYLLRIRAILEAVPHLYMVDPDENRIQALPFFNPNFIGFAADRAMAPAEPPGKIPAQPYWLFILGASDYHPQVKKHGADYFHAVLTGKLGDALDQGRGAALIAPEACIAALESNALLEECVLIRYCDYKAYMSILLGAEYAFYWNFFSASILARLLNRMPVLFFACGHLAEANPRMFRKGMDRYYGEAEVTCLDPADRLSCSELKELAMRQEERLFTPFLRNVRTLPSPETVVRGLMQVRPQALPISA